MKNMGDYHDHYLQNVVLLSSHVFEKFIAACLKFYGLDPCHYFSFHGLTWDAMLKVTKKYLILTSTYFLKKGLRGGIPYFAKRYAKANNKYMNDYDPKKLSTFISYLEGFKWLKNVDIFDVMSISEKF